MYTLVTNDLSSWYSASSSASVICRFVKLPSIEALSTVVNRNSHLSLVGWKSIIMDLRYKNLLNFVPLLPLVEVECGFGVVSGYLQCSTERRLLGIFGADWKYTAVGWSVGSMPSVYTNWHWHWVWDYILVLSQPTCFTVDSGEYWPTDVDNSASYILAFSLILTWIFTASHRQHCVIVWCNRNAIWRVGELHQTAVRFGYTDPIHCDNFTHLANTLDTVNIEAINPRKIFFLGPNTLVRKSWNPLL